ncbi:MAG: hypothetical protein ACP5O1_02670 [Phycisphaerae bacterium]
MTGCASAGAAQVRPEVISVNGQSPGRTFQGIGGESAGASTRLLVDYPRKQRNEILELLFKPDFGASLQALKCELGGDINSTDGTEPAYFRTRAEYEHPKARYFQRGYETWLMEKAAALNPKIRLGLLQWGAPGWLGLGHHPQSDYNARFYSQDNANYIARVAACLWKFDRIRINFVGCANERMWNVPWVLKLRRALNRDGLSHVHIEMADYFNWNSLVEAIRKNAAFAHAISAIGRHYPHYQSTAQARALGIPLWSGEDWSGARPQVARMAEILNRNYVQGRMTRTIIWALEESYYKNLVCYRDGLLMAREPWCDHYRVPGVVWAVAQTTQFAQPGWRYLNSGCRLLSGGGSVVALESPHHRNFSIVIETEKAVAPQSVELKFSGGLPEGKVLHIWRTLPKNYFVQQPDVNLHHHQLLLTLLPHAIYSITTTHGQHKGTFADIPKAAPFPFPYRTRLVHADIAGVPKYFSDQEGAFEIVKPTWSRRRVLEQVITGPQIPWIHQHRPFTIVGSTHWRNYITRCSIRLAGRGTAGILARIESVGWRFRQKNGVRFMVGAQGTWELIAYGMAGKGKRFAVHPIRLAHGRVPPLGHRWHRLTLICSGKTIMARFDSKVLTQVTGRDVKHFSMHGMVGLATGWNHAWFKNCSVEPLRQKP